MMNLLLLFGLTVFLLVSLLSPKNKMASTKKMLYLFSLISTVVSAFIPNIGYQIDNNGYHYFGFPAEGFVYRGGWVFTISSLGLLFNFFLFY
ncbi:hypothetical protein [Lederbergia lenta]|uniref:Group-specific protein n=1 Tax=Lederbergia lenta TaxID=1467 RepID=A0A2X4WAS1_LEDLE|nr:hypothetical protein [Lederbergia lenta]MCM3109792.1 hypothetical protein [Lederbergia lenta]MEC2324458.1 hypothetical protein [Lederbergia lenta]SQI59819.1 group-specific protein [Lederbergia lenta]